MKRFVLSFTVALATLLGSIGSAEAAPINIGTYGRACSGPRISVVGAWGVAVGSTAYASAYYGAYSNANPPGVLQYSNYCETILHGQTQFPGINLAWYGNYFVGYTTVYCCRRY